MFLLTCNIDQLKYVYDDGVRCPYSIIVECYKHATVEKVDKIGRKYTVSDSISGGRFNFCTNYDKCMSQGSEIQISLPSKQE